MAIEAFAAVTHEAEIAVEARRENLGSLLRFVDDASRSAALPAEVASVVRLATEEACANVIAYGYPARTPGPLVLHFTASEDRVEITVRDNGIPFDPTTIPPANVDLPLERREVGGLGWHLIRQVMDEVTHERLLERGNRLTLVKHLRTQGAG